MPPDAVPPDDLERERQRRRLAEERVRSLERDVQAAEARARTAERRLGRVLGVPPIRAAVAARQVVRGARHGIASGLARVRRAPGAVRYRLSRWFRSRTLRATPAAEAHFIARLRAETPASRRTDGPLVTIVMLNRDGEAHLRRAILALDRTDYRSIELLVVDNGSTDGSLAFLESTSTRFPIRIIRNAENRPFGEANDQGVAAAAGELVLLLNNDIEPILPGWLGHMVETLLADEEAGGGAGGAGPVAVGARLVYPRHRGGPRAGEQHADLTLQHRGVELALEDGLAVPRVMGAGESPFGPLAVGVSEVPALTAACLLLRRATYGQLGGFARGYDYGWEDMDLCLRLRAGGGALVHDGRAVLWHHESATRRRADPAAARARREANRARFIDDWAPRLFREVFRDAVRGGGRWTRSPLRVAIVADAGGEEDRSASSRPGASAGLLATGLAALGWQVVRLTTGDARLRLPAPAFDVLVSLSPALDVRALSPGLVRLAWCADDDARWPGTAWFDDYDIILGDGPDSEPAAAIRGALDAWTTARRFAIRIGPPNHEVAPRWGDLWFARVIQRELLAAGHPARVEILPDWGRAGDIRSDVTLHLFGQSQAPTRPGQVNLLWQISHPDLATPGMYDRYDLVFVASDLFAARMAPLAHVPVLPLHQATDPVRFHSAEGGPAHQLLFVANSRNVRRRILDDLLPTDHDLAVFGSGWTRDLLDPRHLAGTSIANEDLHRYYAAAAIVLSDHWTDMRDEGFIANRLYDALASGAFVISDEVEGIDAEFDGAVVTYRTAPELRALVDRWLADPDGRRERAERGRRAVLARHTFASRVATILAEVEPRLRERPAGVEVA